MGNCCKKWSKRTTYEKESLASPHETLHIKLPNAEFISTLTAHDSAFYIAQEDQLTCFQDFSPTHSVQTAERIKALSVADYVLTAGRNIEVRSRAFSPLCSLTGHSRVVNSLIQQGNLVVSGGTDWTTRLWDVTKQCGVAQNSISWNVVTSMCWVPSTSCFVQTSEDLSLRLWDTRQGLSKEAARVHVGSNFATCCDVGEFIVTGHRGFAGEGCTVQTWDVRTLQPLHCFSNHSEAVTGVKVNEESLLSCGKDGKLVKQAATGEVAAEWSHPTKAPFHALELFQEGALVANSEPKVLYFTLSPLEPRQSAI